MQLVGGLGSRGQCVKAAVAAVVQILPTMVPLVARLAEALGLPGNTPDAVDVARDKVTTG